VGGHRLLKCFLFEQMLGCDGPKGNSKEVLVVFFFVSSRERKKRMTMTIPTLTSKATFGTRRQLTISLSDALAIVIAFCWAVEDPMKPYGGTNPRIWAYRSYDAALRDLPNPLEAAIAAANGLNAGMSAESMLRILAMSDAGELPDLTLLPPFWTLNSAKLNTDPNDDSPEGILWQWYHAMKAIDGVGGAVSAKVGFHYAPQAMPLWDSVVGRFWDPKKMWGQIADNIVAEAEWLETLEDLVEHYRVNFQASSGVRLNRSRLVDVLTWGEGVGQYQSLLSHGAHLLSGLPDPSTW
jgi:Family of unknown function (DUF6308)